MGAVSHFQMIRRMVNGAPRPPVDPHRGPCQGFTQDPGHWRDVLEDGKHVLTPSGDWERRWVEPSEQPCRRGCSPFLPEVNYCAHHVPGHLVETLGRRAELWATLAADVWGEVCAEYPIAPTPDEATS